MIAPAMLLEPEINTDHRLGRVSESVCRGIEGGEIRTFVQVSPILKTQAKVWKQAPVDTGSINVDRHSGGRSVVLPAGGHIHQRANTSRRKGTEARDFDGSDPIGGDLMRIGLHGRRSDAAARESARNGRRVGLIRSIERVRGLVTDDGVMDVSDFNDSAGRIGWALHHA